MDHIILYTIDCPKCHILQSKLQDKKLSYVECSNTETMKELGITTVPVLSVNGELLEFKAAVDWVNQQ